MSVSAKFYCNPVTEFAGGTKSVHLSAVYAGPDASDEDKAFWTATPMGKVELSITNPSAANFFRAGSNYYLTFVEVVE